MKDRIPENVVHIDSVGDGFLVFQGLSHLGLCQGKMVKVARQEGGAWGVQELARLDGAPRLVSRVGDSEWVVLTDRMLHGVDGHGRMLRSVPLPEALYGPLAGVAAEGPGRWLVISPTALYLVAEDGKSTLLLSAEFMYQPELNSIVRMDDGTVFIGMRHYLLRLTPAGDGYRAERLEPVG